MNRPLTTNCPCCSGTGAVSWLRSGAWINEHCPARNGPCDVDSSPLTHELDNFREKRKVRIEYKRVGESMAPGQDFHFRAELESTRPEWKNILIIVWDEGQTTGSDRITFICYESGKEFAWWEFMPKYTDTVRNLGSRIAKFLWPSPV